jgi:hypothetical protein
MAPIYLPDGVGRNPMSISCRHFSAIPDYFIENLCRTRLGLVATMPYNLSRPDTSVS